MDFVTRLAEYWMCGVAGGLIHDLLAHKGLKLWSYDRRSRVLRLGFIGSALLGVGAAVLADGSMVTAFAAAIAGPHVIEVLVARLMPQVADVGVK